MSREDAIVLASRTLALLMIVWALADASYLPEEVYSFLRYVHPDSVLNSANQHWYHYYVIMLGFRITRVAGFSLLARWLYQGGPEVNEMFSQQSVSQKM